MNFKNLGALLVALLLTAGVGSASATPLLGRDINRNAVAANDANAVYLWDQDLGITWLRDANINGIQTWDTQVAWADALSTGSGVNTIDNWRLPSIMDTGSAGCDLSYSGGTDCGTNVDTSGSEMAHLFYVTLGNLAYCNPDTSSVASCIFQSGYGLQNVGDFLNMQSRQSDGYWSGTEYAPSPIEAWGLYFFAGTQTNYWKGIGKSAMAVRHGDVLAVLAADNSVPEPGSLTLVCLGLAGLAAGQRKRKA